MQVVQHLGAVLATLRVPSQAHFLPALCPRSPIIVKGVTQAPAPAGFQSHPAPVQHQQAVRAGKERTISPLLSNSLLLTLRPVAPLSLLLLPFS